MANDRIKELVDEYNLLRERVVLIAVEINEIRAEFKQEIGVEYEFNWSEEYLVKMNSDLKNFLLSTSAYIENAKRTYKREVGYSYKKSPNPHLRF